MTQKEIAAIVGVSISSVSQVLHQVPHSRVSEETRAQILSVAREMGYVPRGLTTRSISVVVPSQGLLQEVTTNVLTIADEVLRQRGYRMSMSTLEPENFHQAAELFHPKAVDGVLFADWFPDQERYLAQLEVPWIMLADEDTVSTEVDQVGTDTAATAQSLVRHLLELGHRRVCIVTGRAGIGNHERLKRGAAAAYREAGLPTAWLTTVHWEPSIALESLLFPQLEGGATALVTGSPGTAQLVLNRLQSRGWRVPEQVSLASLLDSQRLALLEPAVTATTAVGRQTITRALERLLLKIRQPGTAPAHLWDQGELVPRASVAPPVG